VRFWTRPEWGYLSLMHTVLVITISRTLPKKILSLFCMDAYSVCWPNFNHFDVLARTNATEFNEITQYNGQYAVQGHSRPILSVPIESPYARNHVYILCCTLSEIWRIIGRIFVVDGIHIYLTQSFGVNSKCRIKKL